MYEQKMVRDSLDKISKMDRTNRWLFNTISPFLGRRILDAGCGNGNITNFLRDKELVVAVDNDELSIEAIKEKFSLIKNLKVINFDIRDTQMAAFLKKEKIDTILCMNTLEHIKDDQAVLSNFNESMEDNGRLIILVPALEFLYSSLDKAAGHFRRYKKKEIIDKLKKNNFSVQYAAYLNLFGIIGWFLEGKVFKKKELSGGLLNLFDGLVSVFIFLENLIGSPLGLSLLVIGRKVNRRKED